MALYNEIQVGRLNRFLQKYLGMKGGPPAAQLQGDIGATINLFSGAENRPLESWFRYGVAGTAAAFAAQTTNIRLRNPKTSGVIAVLEAVRICTTAALDQFFLSHNVSGITTDFGAVQTPAPLDARAKLQNSALVFSTGNNASTTIPIMVAAIGAANGFADFIFEDDQELVISPGAAIQIDDLVVNQAVRYHMIWRERALEDSELTV